MEQKAKHPLASPCNRSEASSGLPHGTKSEASFGLPLLKGDGRGIKRGTEGGSEGKRGIYKGRGGSIKKEEDLHDN